MATKKKGCGFLIAALVILIIGGVIAGILGMSAVNSGKDFVENINKGDPFVTPATLTYTPKEDGEVTLWITGDQTEDFSGIEVEITDASGNTSKANKPSGTSNMGNQHLIGSFSVKGGSEYKLKATGAEAGRTIRVSTLSPSVVLSMLGKGFGAFGAFGAAAVVAFILGIIGLVKFLGSKKADTPAEPAPPAV